MKSFYRPLIHLLHWLIPKRNHVVIYGWPDFEDNVLALEDALQSTTADRIILLVTEPLQSARLSPGKSTEYVRKNSPRGFWLFASAKFVFFTHSCFARRFPRNVCSINVWHGMPIKKIGRMLPGSDVIDSSHIVATSPFWGDIMRDSMSENAEILNTGLPRNDRFFAKTKEARSNLAVQSTSKIVTWLPTYRKSVRGAMRMDGHNYDNVFAMPDVDPRQLNKFLALHNTVLFVKPHPMALSVVFDEFEHLKIIDDRWLQGKQVSLYQLLGISDLLISDISSVVIDYLLLDRPIIHAFPDLKEYQTSRGFTVEPIQDYFAGHVVCNQAELFSALESEISGEDLHADKRRKLLDLSHTHKDNKATERLLEAVGLHRQR